MRFWKSALVGAATAALTYAAIAQVGPTLTTQFLTGNEVVRMSAGGQEVDAIVSTIRSASPDRLFSTGGTIPINVTDFYLIMTASALTATFQLPNPSPAGDVAYVCNGTGSAETSITVSTIAGTQSQTLATTYSAQALAAHSCARFVFDLPTLTWYQL